MTGSTKWFDRKKGFGFIKVAGLPDIFVHYSDIEGEGFKCLNDGQTVEFELVQRPGGYAAVKVRPLNSVPATAQK